MGFGMHHLFSDCGKMKFFLLLVLLLLLFDSPQASTLPHRRKIRALNTTLQTNFNGTYERRNPCTNAEIETSSYVASHEFHHHTKEDNWSDYTHRCSAIISSFLQAIGNLVRFNNKQNGIFNFHINTSISQKQDGHQEPGKCCNSMPTIIIEATDCQITPRKQAKAVEGKNVGCTCPSSVENAKATTLENNTADIPKCPIPQSGSTETKDEWTDTSMATDATSYPFVPLLTSTSAPDGTLPSENSSNDFSQNNEQVSDTFGSPATSLRDSALVATAPDITPAHSSISTPYASSQSSFDIANPPKASENFNEGDNPSTLPNFTTQPSGFGLGTTSQPTVGGDLNMVSGKQQTNGNLGGQVPDSLTGGVYQTPSYPPKIMSPTFTAAPPSVNQIQSIQPYAATTYQPREFAITVPPEFLSNSRKSFGPDGQTVEYSISYSTPSLNSSLPNATPLTSTPAPITPINKFPTTLAPEIQPEYLTTGPVYLVPVTQQEMNGNKEQQPVGAVLPPDSVNSSKNSPNSDSLVASSEVITDSSNLGTSNILQSTTPATPLPSDLILPQNQPLAQQSTVSPIETISSQAEFQPVQEQATDSLSLPNQPAPTTVAPKTSIITQVTEDSQFIYSSAPTPNNNIGNQLSELTTYKPVVNPNDFQLGAESFQREPSDRNLDYTTQTPFYDSVSTTNKNEPESQPELISSVEDLSQNSAPSAVEQAVSPVGFSTTVAPLPPVSEKVTVVEQIETNSTPQNPKTDQTQIASVDPNQPIVEVPPQPSQADSVIVPETKNTENKETLPSIDDKQPFVNEANFNPPSESVIPTPPVPSLQPEGYFSNQKREISVDRAQTNFAAMQPMPPQQFQPVQFPNGIKQSMPLNGRPFYNYPQQPRQRAVPFYPNQNMNRPPYAPIYYPQNRAKFYPVNSPQGNQQFFVPQMRPQISQNWYPQIRNQTYLPPQVETPSAESPEQSLNIPPSEVVTEETENQSAVAPTGSDPSAAVSETKQTLSTQTSTQSDSYVISDPASQSLTPVSSSEQPPLSATPLSVVEPTTIQQDSTTSSTSLPPQATPETPRAPDAVVISNLSPQTDPGQPENLKIYDQFPTTVPPQFTTQSYVEAVTPSSDYTVPNQPQLSQNYQVPQAQTTTQTVTTSHEYQTTQGQLGYSKDLPVADATVSQSDQYVQKNSEMYSPVLAPEPQPQPSLDKLTEIPGDKPADGTTQTSEIKPEVFGSQPPTQNAYTDTIVQETLNPRPNTGTLGYVGPVPETTPAIQDGLSFTQPPDSITENTRPDGLTSDTVITSYQTVTPPPAEVINDPAYINGMPPSEPQTSVLTDTATPQPQPTTVKYNDEIIEQYQSSPEPNPQPQTALKFVELPGDNIKNELVDSGASSSPAPQLASTTAHPPNYQSTPAISETFFTAKPQFDPENNTNSESGVNNDRQSLTAVTVPQVVSSYKSILLPPKQYTFPNQNFNANGREIPPESQLSSTPNFQQPMGQQFETQSPTNFNSGVTTESLVTPAPVFVQETEQPQFPAYPNNNMGEIKSDSLVTSPPSFQQPSEQRPQSQVPPSVSDAKSIVSEALVSPAPTFAPQMGQSSELQVPPETSINQIQSQPNSTGSFVIPPPDLGQQIVQQTETQIPPNFGPAVTKTVTETSTESPVTPAPVFAQSLEQEQLPPFSNTNLQKIPSDSLVTAAPNFQQSIEQSQLPPLTNSNTEGVTSEPIVRPPPNFIPQVGQSPQVPAYPNPNPNEFGSDPLPTSAPTIQQPVDTQIPNNFNSIVTETTSESLVTPAPNFQQPAEQPPQSQLPPLTNANRGSVTSESLVRPSPAFIPQMEQTPQLQIPPYPNANPNESVNSGPNFEQPMRFENQFPPNSNPKREQTAGPINSQIQSPPQPFESYSNNAQNSFPRKRTIVEETITTDFPLQITSSPIEDQLAYADQLLNNSVPLKGGNIIPTTPSPNAPNGQPFQPVAASENLQNGQLNTQTETAEQNPGSPDRASFAEYDQVLPPQEAKERIPEYEEIVPPNLDPQTGGRPIYPQTVFTPERQPGYNPYGYGPQMNPPLGYNQNIPANLPQRQTPFTRNNEALPPPSKPHSNPLLQTLETHLTLPLHDPPEPSASIPEPRGPSPLPLSRDPSSSSEIVPPTNAGQWNPQPNFLNSQSSQPNGAREVMSAPRPESRILVSDQTDPLNGPGEDYIACCERCRRGHSPLLCPFDPIYKGNMTAPSYYILVSKQPGNQTEELFKVEKVYLGDGVPLNCTLGDRKTFPTSEYTTIPFRAERAVKLPIKSDSA